MIVKRDDRTIVFLVGGPLTHRWIQYYCLDTLNLYFNLEFWDCSALVSHPYDVTNVLFRPYAFEIKNVSSVKKRLRNLPVQSIVVPEIGLHKSNFKLFKLISKYVKHCVIIDIWDPVVLSNDDKFVPKLNVYKSKSLKNILYKSTLIKILLKFLKYGYTDEFKKQYQLICEYNESVDWNNWENKCINLFSVKFISTNRNALYRVNNVDFEKYKLIYNTPILLNERYVVFVGQFFPYHPDFRISVSSEVSIDGIAQRYFNSLNAFFDAIESKYYCRVVIAEHPSAKHDNNPFNDRKIIYFKTAELIKDSLGVCMHYSNAISFVALYNKPLVVLGFNTLNLIRVFDDNVSFFANNLKINALYIDEPYSVEQIKQRTIDPTIRMQILSKVVGDINLSNDLLFVKCFSKIFDDFKW